MLRAAQEASRGEPLVPPLRAGSVPCVPMPQERELGAEGEGRPLEAWAPVEGAVPLLPTGLRPGSRLESLRAWGLGGGVAPEGGIGTPHCESISRGHTGSVPRWAGNLGVASRPGGGAQPAEEQGR